MEERRVCSKCCVEKGMDCFSLRTDNGKTTYRRECKKCVSERQSKVYIDNREVILQGQSDYQKANRGAANQRSSRWRRDNPDKSREASIKYRNNNRDKERERKRLWYEENKEREKRLSAEWRRNNPDKVRKQNSAWRAANPDNEALRTAKRRAFKSNATPPWLTSEHHRMIEKVYAHSRDCYMVTGEKYHVDHIVPLQGDNVCGLHVPWNLQVLPADVNISKGNKFFVDSDYYIDETKAMQKRK